MSQTPDPAPPMTAEATARKYLSDARFDAANAASIHSSERALIAATVGAGYAQLAVAQELARIADALSEVSGKLASVTVETTTELTTVGVIDLGAAASDGLDFLHPPGHNED